MAINFSKVIEENGVRFINCTPHEIRFLREDGSEFVLEPSGATLLAKPSEEKVVTDLPLTFVRTVFLPSDAGEKELEEIFGHGKLLPIGSIVSAQAYPGRVVAMTPAPGFERVPPAEKRMNPVKFTTF